LRLDGNHIDGLERLYKTRHDRFKLGKATLEGVLQPGPGTVGGESMVGPTFGLKDYRTYKIRETTGVSKCRGGFEAPQLFVSDPKVDQTVPNFH
jgi:hypothetical protein